MTCLENSTHILNFDVEDSEIELLENYIELIDIYIDNAAESLGNGINNALKSFENTIDNLFRLLRID